ncbi:hypothetical protein ACYQR9_02715 [Methylobacterium sp. CM6241]|jgi:hypothetical protein|uniref:hypothetical protein n=1 Tax=unclassified Methylobacterium TaxID=2615210 RepID=UPI0006F8CD90|nr:MULTISPECIES: hypothetical protein [unclassified Methylobacterium]KQO49356.1 hypothetical protein ASF24_09410 [Methylobacterium sp. Leaf86]KQP00417.1 hypothetical protein ASF32_00550 [Methylobacterium sp. Leaf91]
MSDPPQPPATIVGTQPRPAYRVLVLSKEGTILDVRRISVDSDDDAIQHTQRLVDGHALELWDGLRFIEQFLPTE